MRASLQVCGLSAGGGEQAGAVWAAEAGAGEVVAQPAVSGPLQHAGHRGHHPPGPAGVPQPAPWRPDTGAAALKLSPHVWAPLDGHSLLFQRTNTSCQMLRRTAPAALQRYLSTYQRVPEDTLSLTLWRHADGKNSSALLRAFVFKRQLGPALSRHQGVSCHGHHPVRGQAEVLKKSMLAGWCGRAASRGGG